MKIKMLETTQGSECGKFTKTFYEGELYEVVDSLGNVFVNIKVAELVIDESLVELKKVEEPLQNKAITGKDYKNKSKGK